MGTHAKPRRRVRSAALGTLAVGATLTGVGLTAAALDPSGAVLADGTYTGDPVNFAASGLGAPVPVADVSSLDGSSAGSGAVVPRLGTNSSTSGVTATTPVSSYIPSLDDPIANVVQTKRKSPAVATRRTAAASESSNTRAVGAGSAPNTSPTSGAASGKTAVAGTSPAAVPSLDASLPISTALPVPSLPTIANLTTTMNHAKSTLAGLLGEVAGLV